MAKRSKPEHDQSLLYTSASFYMLRAPILSTTLYKQITSRVSEDIPDDPKKCEVFLSSTRQHSQDILKKIVSQPEIEQAFAVASTSLLEGLARIQEKKTSSSRLEHSYAHILRYLIRMCTRPTPFGLFSGVAIGNFADQTTAQLVTPTARHIRTRPDMGWLFALIQKIEQNKDFISHYLLLSITRSMLLAHV